MQIRIFSSLLLPVIPAYAVPSECQVCHGESKTETMCTNCHTTGLRPTENRNVNGLYKNAPVFNSKQLTELKPFALIGLQDYLANPIARRRHFGNMYSMSQIQISQFSREFALWSKPSNYLPDSKLVSQGKKIFIDAGCEFCHGIDGKYPMLPIGSAIYNFQYFNFILDGGAPYYQVNSRLKKMPNYKKLDLQKRRQVYSYISLTSPKNSSELEKLTFLSQPNSELYRSVTGIFRKNGCIHCHGATNTETGKFFGGTPENFKLQLKEQTIEILPHFFESRGPILSKKKLLDVLEERVSEHDGKNSDLRGMPLSLPPLNKSELRIVKEWISQGCEALGKYLCL